MTCSVLGGLVEPFKRMVAYMVEFYRRLAAFCRVRGSYELTAPARYVGLRGTTLAARRALNNLVHPFALPFERVYCGGAWSRARSRTLAKVLFLGADFYSPGLFLSLVKFFLTSTDLRRSESDPYSTHLT